MEDMLLIAISSLGVGITLGTLLGTEVYKRRITQTLVVQAREPAKRS
jgi:hypothetical protein